MLNVTGSLKRVSSRRNSIKSKTAFVLESSLPFSLLPLLFSSPSPLVQNIVIPSYIHLDPESDYGVWIERGDKIYKTSYSPLLVLENESNHRNPSDGNGLTMINFHEKITLSVTMFQDRTGKYLVSLLPRISS
jgi:hypothetical protein